VHDLITNNIDTYKFFDYDIHSPLVYEKRRNDIIARSFPREELVDYLIRFNSRYHDDKYTISNIKRLLDPASVVVIGGQQAGILTGPLFTIHKIISILKLAKEQEKKLQVPVIPVFWIAGEDHDFAEINHLYVKERNTIKKKIIPQKQMRKSMVSNTVIDKEIVLGWIHEVFETYGETDFTNQLLDLLQKNLERSETYVDYFIYL